MFSSMLNQNFLTKVNPPSSLIYITWLSPSLQLHKVISGTPFYAFISLDITFDLLENGPNSTLKCADNIVNWNRIDNGFSLLESRGNILIRPSYLSSPVLWRNPVALFRQDLFFTKTCCLLSSALWSLSILKIHFFQCLSLVPATEILDHQWMERISDKYINKYQEPSLFQLSDFCYAADFFVHICCVSSKWSRQNGH